VFSEPQRPRYTSPDSANTMDDDWSTFCSIYQICGTIYMHRALRLKPIDDESVQIATRRGVEMLIGDVLPDMMSHCLIFPILVIGSHCVHNQDRQAVLKALSPSSSYLSFGSLSLMTSFLRESWSTIEMTTDWWTCYSKVSDKAFLF
jgi:hypothetical protein